MIQLEGRDEVFIYPHLGGLAFLPQSRSHNHAGAYDNKLFSPHDWTITPFNWIISKTHLPFSELSLRRRNYYFKYPRHGNLQPRVSIGCHTISGYLSPIEYYRVSRPRRAADGGFSSGCE